MRESERRRRIGRDRRTSSEKLEDRQLLAGPDLVGIQPDQGTLLADNATAADVTVLNVSPTELRFQFNDDAQIDPSTLGGIRITRAGDDGVFETARATSDLGTDGTVLVEFRARQSGTIGNGIEILFTRSDRPGSSLPIVSVNDRVVTIDVNENPARATRVQDLITAVGNSTEADALIEVISVTGPTQGTFGTSVPEGLTLELIGANAAEAVTDFGTGGDVRVRIVAQQPGESGRGIQVELEKRNFGGNANPVVIVNDRNIRVQLNTAPGFETTAQEFIDAINANPDASALIAVVPQEGNVNAAIVDGVTPLPQLTLSGVTDVFIEPGFIGLEDDSRQVVFRFAEPLPDDFYQVDILGNGPSALLNVEGEAFGDGENLTRRFEINLGPKVAAVVPEPIRRTSTGSLQPQVGRIEVHFNEDDLDLASAQNPSFYQLIYTRNTLTNADDVAVVPVSVTYNNITNIATLDFGQSLRRLDPDFDPNSDAPTSAARLRIGSGNFSPAPPTDVSLALAEPGDTIGEAFDLNATGGWAVSPTQTSSATLSSEIINPLPYTLELPGPDLPGTRDLRPDDPSRLTRPVPLDYITRGADSVDGISVIQYDFAETWLGDEPQSPGIDLDRTYFNAITEIQKQRIRESLQLYSEYLGVSFVEVDGSPTTDTFISIAVGDLYGGDPRATSGEGGLAFVTRDRNFDGLDDLVVIDFQDVDESTDDEFGGQFFTIGMRGVGGLLGFGSAADLPQSIFQGAGADATNAADNEVVFPSQADIVHGQYMYRPESTDIDLYRFSLPAAGRLSIETLAERLGTPSGLDTALRLYRVGADGSFVEVSANDDYFSNDSLIDLNVTAGDYVVGVSARGNQDYNPAVPGSGFGGLTEGDYDLRLEFRPDAGAALTDSTGVALDGDSDGTPGGDFNFWFVPAEVGDTLFVDKTATAGGNGALATPFREIDNAIAEARDRVGAGEVGVTVRVVGNGGTDGRIETPGDNFAYRVGLDSRGLALEDGSTLDVPRDVQLIFDAGAIVKLGRARIGVGSTLPTIDLSGASLQVLGTPTLINEFGLPARDVEGAVIPGSVIFTSINDNSVGLGSADPTATTPRPGDWGGIDFRGDLDFADESRAFSENDGIFRNHVQFADLRYGGGAVQIGGRNVVVSPIDMAVTRPTIINSRIVDGADAAMAATPDTFAETRFTDARSQSGDAFTLDYDRVGPHISGNTVIENSINGLFVRTSTRTGEALETISMATRFDDTDIVHVVAENLVIEGTAGGLLLTSEAPSVLSIRTAGVSRTGGEVPAGDYVYRLTNVDASGTETVGSAPTARVTVSAGQNAVELNGVPQATGDFTSRRLYRAPADPVTGFATGDFTLVATLNSTSTRVFDTAAAGTTVLSDQTQVLRSQLDASLKIDAGTVVKLDGARIETRLGGNLIAEGTASNPVVFTSINDQRYGGGGTFDTSDSGSFTEASAGQWGGIFVGPASSASIDDAVLAGGGGNTRIPGGFASFNVIEVQQGELRLTDSLLENNADGRGNVDPDGRVGRGDNASATVFVRGATPVVAGNDFRDGEGPVLSFDTNSFVDTEVLDQGRASGPVERIDVFGNSGPLVADNLLTNNSIGGMEIRGGTVAVAAVWDDVDIVHVVRDMIDIPNQHIFGGLRLESDARGSLVVKFENPAGGTAGIVAGGTRVSATDQFRDVAGRIGGALQVIGQPDFPVVLTSLADDFAGAGFTADGRPALDTNNDGLIGGELDGTTGGGFAQLPFGPEVNNGTTIDNDVAVGTPGFFESTMFDGNEVFASGVTVQDLNTGQILIDQDYVFQYSTFLISGGQSVLLANTNVTQPATLIGDDLVESRGTYNGPAGTVDWVATSTFRDGTPVLFTSLQLDGGDTALGDIRVVSYLNEDVEGINDDVLLTTGTPGEADFRAFTLDGPRRVGFSHGGFYENDDINQINATYGGWAADRFNDLQAAIIAGTQTFSIDGDIDQNDLPPFQDPSFGTGFGPADVTTAFAWDTINTATTATVTSFLELVPSDPAINNPFQQLLSGQWDGVTVREGADDRNVGVVTEREPIRRGTVDGNGTPNVSQFLGEIAPNQDSGDENRRLGFIIEGAVATPTDLDVYSFVAESGTEVWLDVDRTTHSLDTIVELIDANGGILALSNDSLQEQLDPTLLLSGNDEVVPLPLSAASAAVPSDFVTFDPVLSEGTGGVISINLAGNTTAATIPLTAFLADPTGSIEFALESTFFSEVGNVDVFQRRGGELVFEIRYDADRFAGSSPPVLQVRSDAVTGVLAAAPVVNRDVGDGQVQDAYSTNPRDAGFRVILPGELGTRNLYHVRVRSAPAVAPETSLEGQSAGSYQLQLRLGETDEHGGTQMNLADVRFAADGVRIIGQPLHSPLLGEDFEIDGDNDTIGNAQELGLRGPDGEVIESGPLSSDRLAKTISGEISGAADVDWYQFDIQYDDLDRDGAAMYLSTIFDLDYADGLGRSDMALYVFNEAGQLILIGGDSNITADQVGPQGDAEFSRGSNGTGDPFIGAAELPEGTYFIAVSNQTQVPQVVDQFFSAGASNPLVRLEPIDSVTRIVEDRINAPGQYGNAGAPVVPVLFDADSIVDNSLDDVLLYVNTATGIQLVNPFNGFVYGEIGDFETAGVGIETDIRDVAFRANGELFGYTENDAGDGPADDASQYARIDTATGDITVLGPLGIVTNHDDAVEDPDVLDVASDDGLQVEAITIREFGGEESGFLIGNRPIARQGLSYSQNILYAFNDETGAVTGPNFDPLSTAVAGAGTDPREIGAINTAGVGDETTQTQLGITDAVEVGFDGVGRPSLRDGDSFTLVSNTNGVEVTFEFNMGFSVVAVGVGFAQDGELVTIDGVTFEFDTNDSFNVGTGNVRVAISNTATADNVIGALASAILQSNIPVAFEGTVLSLPDSSVVTETSNLLSVAGSPAVAADAVEIQLLASDNAAQIAEAIEVAVAEAAARPNNALVDVSARPVTTARSLTISNGFIREVFNTDLGPTVLTAGGDGLGGIVTGIELVGNELYAVTNAGELFVVSAAELNREGGNVQIGDRVDSATDLAGINFTGLRAGPQSVEGGRYADLLFGTADGPGGSSLIYAFDTDGVLQPVFAGGRTSISVAIGGVLGLDFSPVDFNLWHVTDTREDDPGHGINAIEGGLRSSDDGNFSLAFNFEADAFANRFSTFEQFVRLNPDGEIQNPRQDGQDLQGTYNLPGGARGELLSNSFSLEGYAAADQPVMYFNYFINVDDANNDRLRVYVVTDDGVEHLVASNSTFRDDGLFDDEFDDPPAIAPYNDAIDVEVQQIFDNTGTWRQARVPLNEFAGISDLQLRIEFSTDGTSFTGTESLRLVSASELAEGDTFEVGGETFVIDFSPAIELPSGIELSQFYTDPAALATVTIDGQVYAFDDGNRTIDSDPDGDPTTDDGPVVVDLRLPLDPGQLADDVPAELTARDVAEKLRRALQDDPPPTRVVVLPTSIDDSDDPTATDEENDRLVGATLLPYTGGDVRFEAGGEIGGFVAGANPIPDFRTDDIDLVRIDVLEGTVIGATATPVNAALPVVVRYFDSLGNELTPTGGTVTAPADGPIFIGISGEGNQTYDPALVGSGNASTLTDSSLYDLVVDVAAPRQINIDGNLIELQGYAGVSGDPSDLFTVTGQDALSGVPILVSRTDDADAVAGTVAAALANRFFGGDPTVISVSGSTIQLSGLVIDDVGPFAATTDRWGDNFQSGDPDLNGADRATVRADDNANEGVYLDDFIIGFAERGERVTGADAVSTFVTDGSNAISDPADPTSPLDTGSYTVEIRDGSEYISAIAGEIVTDITGYATAHFRQFDTNDSLGESITMVARPATEIVDGTTFSINDGRNTIIFEFDQRLDLSVSDNGISTTGQAVVPIPYTLRAFDPITGGARPQTASEVADQIITAINSAGVTAILDVTAVSATGRGEALSPIITLSGDVRVDNTDDALESVQTQDLRGDENRDRGSQGVVLIENSRFLSNQDFGISIIHSDTTDFTGENLPAIQRFPRNLIELNDEGLLPGVVVRSNVLAYNEAGGVEITGLDDLTGGTQLDPVGYDRIINNTIIGGEIISFADAPPATIGSVVFEQGLISFVDSVVAYQPAAGGNPPTGPFQNPAAALGAPDATAPGAEPVDANSGTVSLGFGGTITLGFDNNLLTGSGDSRPDLIVYETGAIESVTVEISRDGTTFFPVGQVGGLNDSVDLDAFGFGPQDRFAFVRLSDLRQGNAADPSRGADIDAVGALSTVPVDQFLSAGVGISVNGAVAPALLNNVLVNNETGIEIGATSPVDTILGANTFQRNDTNAAGVGLGSFSQVAADSQVLFVDPGGLNFTPAAGSPLIDSSIDSLEDRFEVTVVKGPFGLPPSPIIAPDFDVNGQLRFDDPNVDSPSGLGENVFSDRGAADRGDLTGPRAVLLSPQAPGLGIDAGQVRTFGDVPNFFEVQLVDGLSPADVVPGTGIDDGTVTSGSVLLLADGEALVEGVDYRFGYEPTTNIIRLTPIAGVWEPDTTYTIRMLDDRDAILRGVDGASIEDGSTLSVSAVAGGTTVFEFETGINLRLAPGSVQAGALESSLVTIFDGTQTVEFEFDTDDTVTAGRTLVNVAGLTTDAAAVNALAAAINASGLNLTAAVLDNQLRILGPSALAEATTDQPLLTISGEIGTLVGFGIQIPTDGAAIDGELGDGDSFEILAGGRPPVIFEFESGGGLDNDGAIAIPFVAGQTLDELADEMVRVIGGAGLGLEPVNAGFGRVALGGDATYALQLGESPLTQIGLPGQTASVPVVIPIDATPQEVAELTAAAIDSRDLPGVVTDVVDTQVFVQGVTRVVGAGVVETVAIADRVGNPLQSNLAEGRTELNIFIGGGSDFGDAPAPYTSLLVDGGPSHAIVDGFQLGATNTPDPNARTASIDGDDGDDGVTLGTFQPGFQTNVAIDIVNDDARTMYLDAWFDWDQDGVFEPDELIQAGSIGTGRIAIAPGVNQIAVMVPSDAATGQTFARFRLSEDPNLTSTGAAASGEVEDYPLIVSNNEFNNPTEPADVSANGIVTPLDALLIIGVLTEFDTNSLSLSGLTLADRALLPPFPDVNADGRVSPLDALEVIRVLADRDNSTGNFEGVEGEGVVAASGFVPVAGGVMASGSTALGDNMLASTLRSAAPIEGETPVRPLVGQTRREPAAHGRMKMVRAIDSAIDAIAVSTEDDDDRKGVVDDIFASLV